jgi:maleate cis-trans isomerase
MFLARNTGESRSQQPFVSCNPICSARVVDTIEDMVGRFLLISTFAL